MIASYLSQWKLLEMISQFRRLWLAQKRGLPVIGLLFVVVAISACNDQGEAPDDRLLLWHSLGEKDSLVLESILDEYTKLHPEVTIIREYIPADEIQARYTKRVNEGLGPDMMLISDYQLVPLLKEDLIRDISQHPVDLSDFDLMTLGQVYFQEKLIGIPFSNFTQALCFNRSLIDQAPVTIDDIITNAEAGNRIGLTGTFVDLAWMSPALGGSLLDESGKADFDEDELTEWFEWLSQANKHPNIIINRDIGQLTEAFTAGELAYFICPSWLVPTLRQALGDEQLRIANLPAQPKQTASAFFTTDVIAFSPAADPGSLAQGLRLANFLTNPVQQTTLALETQSQIPANMNVAIDERLAPLEAALIRQPKAAAPLDYIELELISLEIAEPFLVGVLTGELEPSQAAQELTRLIDELWRNQG